MLGKLLKYEIKAFGRVMLPLYGALLLVTLVFSLTMRLSMNSFARTIFEKFALISGFLFVAAIIAVMVVMVVMIIQRFYRNLLGTEGYLMFTLPVTTLQHILGKALSALLWISLGMVTGILAGGIMVAIVGDLKEFSQAVDKVFRFLNEDRQIIVNIILVAVVMVFGIMATISKVYAACSIGHQWGSHRLMGAVLAYIGIGIFELILASLFGLQGFMDRNVTFKQAIGFMIGISTLQILLYGAVAWLLLDRQLNLE